jgi:hypothetical protein
MAAGYMHNARRFILMRVAILLQWSRCLVLATLFCLGLMPANGSLLISEFVAVNDSGLKDEDGDTADWIEIYNNDLVPVNLEGWSLTDEAQNLGKWKFPVTVLSPGQYLIVFASGKDRDVGELHTNFRISITGGFLALVRPDGTTIEHAFPSYPVQYPDIAYGLPGQKREDALIGAASEMLYQDPALGAPEVGWMEAGYEASSWMKGTNGIGYTSGLLDYDPLIRTSLPGPEEGIFTRFNFSSTVENRLDSLKINYDDGFAAFLNGVMIEKRNAPLVLEQDSRAVASHEGFLAMQTETMTELCKVPLWLRTGSVVRFWILMEMIWWLFPPILHLIYWTSLSAPGFTWLKVRP